jgi:hypothetical protein
VWKSQFARVSGNRHIEVRESEIRVVQCHEYRDHDRKSPEKIKERVSVDCISARRFENPTLDH